MSLCSVLNNLHNGQAQCAIRHVESMPPSWTVASPERGIRRYPREASLAQTVGLSTRCTAVEKINREMPLENMLTPARVPRLDLEAKRQAVNQWIRTSHAYDAVIDFDKVLRDPSHPSRLLAAFDGGDHVHPNDTGYKVMADAIDLSLFRDDRD
jgi:lysophospholipase L1-like esterase